ncbi:MAG: hypothetical protein ACRDFS_03130 [Chloroflexota bacterium]
MLDLRLRSGGRDFEATVMRAADEWTLHLRMIGGRAVPESGELYPTLADAVMGALGLALEIGQRSALPRLS